MNKQQELDVMLLRAKMKVEEELKQHEQAWRGEEVEIMEEVEE